MSNIKISSLPFWATVTFLLYGGSVFAGLWGWLPEMQFAVLNRALTGASVSFLFYYLVVHLPESRRRDLVIENLLQNHERLKTELAMQLVFASQAGGRKDLHASPETILELTTVAGFTKLMRHGRKSDEGMYAVANGLNQAPNIYDDIMREVTIYTKLLRAGLSSIRVDDGLIKSELSHLESFLINLELGKRESGEDLGDDKALMNLIWSVFSGWNMIEGQHNTDKIETLLRKL